MAWMLLGLALLAFFPLGDLLFPWLGDHVTSLAAGVVPAVEPVVPLADHIYLTGFILININ
jgi:hypothetical protein